MNPFEAIMGGNGAAQMNAMQTAPAQTGGPFGALQGLQGVMDRARQLAGMFQNPQQLVSKFFPDAPKEMFGNPEQLVGWLQQTGRVNLQTVQMARQMMGNMQGGGMY